MKIFHATLATLWFICLIVGLTSDNVDVKHMIYFAAMFIFSTIIFTQMGGDNNDEDN